jgi:hypothetical protein
MATPHPPLHVNQPDVGREQRMQVPGADSCNHSALRAAPFLEVRRLQIGDSDLELESQGERLPWHEEEQRANIAQQTSQVGAFIVAGSPHVATAELLHIGAQPFG